MILEPGTFLVKDYRRPIPTWVKLQALYNAAIDEALPRKLNVRDLQFDHQPALLERPFDTEINDFIPAQNDPDHIVPLLRADQLKKTTGSKPGAERKVHNRGSDRGEASHVKLVRGTQEMHEIKLAAKRGDPAAIARLLRVEKKPRPKSRIPSRPFSSQNRRI